MRQPVHQEELKLSSLGLELPISDHNRLEHLLKRFSADAYLTLLIRMPIATVDAKKRPVLLVNLGSPNSTSVSDVRSYLREFLSDDRVLDTAKPIQQFVLNCFILPTRPKRSAEAYEKVWTDQGAPLIVTSKNVQALLQERIDDHVELAMRYGSPSIPSAISNLKAKGINKLLLVPLYPHYAMSSYETVVVRVMEEIAAQMPDIEVEIVQPFYNDPDYIEALYQSAKPYLETEFDHLLFSYHGIPARHLSKADSSKGHCRIVKDCCSVCSPAHATCYKAQTLATTNAFVARAGLTLNSTRFPSNPDWDASPGWNPTLTS